MFRISENFILHDKDVQPYNMEIIKNSSFTHKHGCVKEQGYAIICSGNNCMIHSPELTQFDLTAKVQYGRVNLTDSKWRFYPIEDAEWMVFFDYNKDTRCGKAVSFRTCVKDGCVKVKYLDVTGIKRILLKELVFDNKVLSCDDVYDVFVSVKDGKLSGSFADCDFSFDIDSVKGRVGFMTENFPGEFFIREFDLVSEDKFKEKVLMDKKLTIPMLNGGKVPYEVSVKVTKIDETLFMDYKLDGGCPSNPIDENCGSSGQYSVEWDRFLNPRIVIKNKYKEQGYYLKNGEMAVHDPNIHWEHLEQCVPVDHLPFEKRSGLPEDLWCKDTQIIFAYDSLRCKGYAMQEGAAEFRYDKNGELLYAGKPLEDGLAVISSYGTEAFKLIPSDMPEMDKIKEHFENNHYFVKGEQLDFSIKLFSSRRTGVMTVKAVLCDAFGDEIETFDADIKNICESGLERMKILEYSASHEGLSHGVYRIKFVFSLEGEEVYSKASTFEVIDPNETVSPAVASGLPYLYSTPNEDIGLIRDAFDVWNPMPDLDHNHYFSCMAYTPSIGMNRKVPEIKKPFKREWFVWLGGRTEPDYDNLEKFSYALKAADYIQYPDCCGFNIWRMPSPRARGFLNDFLNENPEYKKKLSFDVVDDTFTKDMYDEILTWDECREAWFTYCNERSNKEIKRWDDETFAPYTNNFPRTGYGPINCYTIPYATYYTMRHFGREANGEIGPSDFFGGFCQFEDYPYSCSYKTYRSALAMSSIKLWDKNLTMYPEMYQNGSGMCPDGAVAFANPPYASYICPTYFHGTQVLEAAFGTPIRRDNGYDYWRDYGFMARDFPKDRLESLISGWKNVRDHKPQKPVKTVGFITDFTYGDTRYDVSIKERELPDGMIYNISEEGVAFLYGCAREAGQPAGAVLKLETVKNLDPDEMTMLVVPSLRGADKEVVDALRNLYNKGVALFAISHIDGLEDIFGVEPDEKVVKMATLSDGNITESVYPCDNEFRYRANGADVLVYANDGQPALFKNGRAALINASVSHLALDAFVERIQTGRECISEMLKGYCRDIFNELSNGPVKADGCGVNAFIDEHGDTVLMPVNYSPYDQKVLYDSVPAAIDLFELGAKDLETDHKVKKFFKDGKLFRIEFELLPHQYAIMKLIK